MVHVYVLLVLVHVVHVVHVYVLECTTEEDITLETDPKALYSILEYHGTFLVTPKCWSVDVV